MSEYRDSEADPRSGGFRLPAMYRVWHRLLLQSRDNYPDLCICQDEESACPADILEGFVKPSKSKLVAVAPCLCRLGTAAMQEELRLFTEHELEDKRRHRDQRRTTEHATDFLRDLPLAPDIGRHRVHRPTHPRILQGEPVEPNDVVDVNPGKPLATVPQRTANEQSKWQGQESKSERLAAEDHGGADSDDPDSKRFSFLRRGFPLLAEAGEERIAGLALLGDHLVAAVPVVVDARRTDEHRRPLGGRLLERLHQGSGRG